MEESARGLF